MTSENMGGASRSSRILVVDDFEPWRRFVRLTLQIRPEYQIIGEVSDGLEAVQKAQELQPDLIVLDIGLPILNGIEAARRIRTHAPESKILFLSENRSLDIAEEALRSGGSGYVLKSDAAGELALAVKAVLQGKRFISASLAGIDSSDRPDPTTGYRPFTTNVTALTPPTHVESPKRHEVTFYSDDQRFLDDLTLFIGTTLKDGNAAIVVATESHRASLLQRLQAGGVDVAAAMERKRYISLDVPGTISQVQFAKVVGDFVVESAKTAGGEHLRVAAG